VKILKIVVPPPLGGCVSEGLPVRSIPADRPHQIKQSRGRNAITSTADDDWPAQPLRRELGFVRGRGES
jgi:hypothetical protein